MDFAPDYLHSKYHSEKLCDKIRAYYRRYGKEVKVWVEDEGTYYVVRSNIRFTVPTS